MFATVMTVIPGFLAGALAVQIRDELEVAESTYGWALGSFFLAAMAGSMLLGRVAQGFGPRRQVVAALLVSSVSSLAISFATVNFAVLVALLTVSGFANSANQSAVNLLLVRAQVPRLGLAIALKQSAMPAAALLGGLSVPLVATTLGWRWVYALCAIGAVGAAFVVWTRTNPEPVTPRSSRAQPRTERPVLVAAAVGFGCLAYGAGTLNAWLVSSAHDHAGIAESPAGLLLSLGAGFGVTVRLVVGTRLDTMRRSPFVGAAVLSAIGSIGVLGLASTTGPTVVAATIVAFGTGWIWPIFTNFGVIRANAEAAAAATGFTQTGVYLGVFGGPLISGYLIESAGYPSMWAATAAIMAVGAVVVYVVAPSFSTLAAR